MTSNIPIVTLLIKACPNHVLPKVVHAIETFDFDRGFLKAPLNMAPDQVLLTTKEAKTSKACQLETAEEVTSLYDQIIYMKTTGYEAAVQGLKAFVEDNLNAEHGTSMYCVEVKPKKYQTFFPVVFVHDEILSKQELVDLFSPFGKCNIRTKNDKMTYINYRVFEQVEVLLLAMDNSQLKFQHMVVHDGVYPVQNSKLMLLFDKTFNSEYDLITCNNCITKVQLSTWFHEVKKKASCEKTWDELVDFLSERIWMRFNWTYNVDMAAFCALLPDISVEASTFPTPAAPTSQEQVTGTLANSPDEIIALTMDDNTMGAPDSLMADAVIMDHEKCAEDLHNVHNGQDIGNYTIFHETPLWNTNMLGAMSNITQNAEDGNILQDAQMVYENTFSVVDKMNNIPLYGDESHPLHLKLCVLEQQLFGKHEQSNVSIHYRLMNMESMMNINGVDQPLPVHLTDLSCWIQQYLLCV